MNTPKTKTFRYSLEVVDIPHTADTVEYSMGTDYFNPDYGEDCWAREILGRLFQDATSNRLQMQMRLAGDDSNSATVKAVMEHNESLIKAYREIEKTLKLVKNNE